MPCYHPMKGFIVGKTENGKKDMIIAPYDTECIFKPKGSEVWEKHGHVLDRLVVQGKVVTEFVPIPCGQCVGCRLEYSRQWAIRCMLESEYHEHNYFLTITYDEKNVPRSEYLDEETGAFEESLTLDKSHLQKFCKDLRAALSYRGKDSFRFYSCGEYGSRSARPHYHMIAFGLDLDDLKLYGRYPTGILYTSEFLDTVWKKGKIYIGSVTFESCAYVSRYIMKKQKGKGAKVYETFNISPEFTNMSRRPGIGSDFFFDKYKEIYPDDHIVLDGGNCVRPPAYFDRLLNDLDEFLMESVKLKRVEIAERIQEYKSHLSTETYQEQLKSAERNKEAQVKKLARVLD